MSGSSIVITEVAMTRGTFVPPSALTNICSASGSV
jgi:hypothetical protein